jgi:hypothetical protein
MNNCNALIWDKNNPAKLFSSTEIISEWIIDARPKEWIILYGLLIDGESNWIWWTHSKNIAWLNFRFWKNLSMNYVTFNKSWYWIYIYDSDNIDIVNSNASYNNDTGIYAYASWKILLERIYTSNNNKSGIYMNSAISTTTLSNITAHDNTENGIYVRGSNRYANKITSYNNGQHWIMFTYWSPSKLSNITTYNNLLTWITLSYFIWLELDTIISNNNTETGLYTYAVWDIRANNITTHNNLKSWFYNLSEKWTNNYKNITSYGNTQYGFYIREYGSINDTIDNITTYSNLLDGILLYGTKGLVWTNLKSYSNMGAGMKLTYNEWGITINNSEFYSNTWHWLDTWAMWWMNLNNITANNNAKGWIFNSATKLSNNFTGIKTYSNVGNWFYIRSSGSKNDNLNNMISYNNGWNWIHLYQINEVDLNNSISFNNSWHGYTTWYSSLNTINNSKFFNNWSSWIYYNIWNNNIINNTYSYNNGIYWLWLSNSQWNKLNNLGIYNNTNKALYSYAGGTWDGSGKYYGNTSIYGNSDNITPKLTQGADWFLWMIDWILNNSWTYSQDQSTTINNSGWDYSIKWKQSVTMDWNEVFRYGSNIPKQSQPIKYFSTANIYYWIDWDQYNTSKFIWE